MPEIDADLVSRRLAEIKLLAEELKEILDMGLEKFLSDSYVRDAAKYRLLVAIEAAIAICNHIAVRAAKEVPGSYSDCFIILGKSGVISEELAKKLAEMAKFRNMLVHVYWKIDDRKVYDIIGKDLSDLDRFIDEVRAYLGHG
ncbi:type VII toxin-antitoxin system HepT family RNase toxin [Geoglobus acetivorans]|uniref:DUF86 domain-containing protein n=1 Tax=Geoglobus acetivorans TaxID=565033 RepID=A0A0A7GB71_GEOAI|nr:hypothetical protein GACE_0197 [Geoglobus acetivorans]